MPKYLVETDGGKYLVETEDTGPVRNSAEPNARLAEMPPEQSIGSSAWQDIKGTAKGFGNAVTTGLNFANPIPKYNTFNKVYQAAKGAQQEGVFGQAVKHLPSDIVQGTIGSTADWINKEIAPPVALGLKQGIKQSGENILRQPATSLINASMLAGGGSAGAKVLGMDKLATGLDMVNPTNVAAKTLGGSMDLAGKGLSAMADKMPTLESRLYDLKDSLKTLKNTYDDGVRYSYQDGKKVEISNPVKTIADRNLVPIVKDGKIDATGVIQKLNDELDNLETNRNVTLPADKTIPLNDFMQKAVDTIKSSKQLKNSGMVGPTIKKAETIFDDYRQSFGDEITISTVDDIRTAMNKRYDPDLRDANRAIGDASRKIVYEASPESRGMLMQEGQVIDARDFAEKMNGHAVKGGRLGKMFSGLGGAVIGSAAGQMVGHPVIGGLVGTEVGKGLQSLGQRTYFKPPVPNELTAALGNKLSLGGKAVSKLGIYPNPGKLETPPSLSNNSGTFGGVKATGFNSAPNKFSMLTDRMQRFEINDKGAKLRYSPKQIIDKISYQPDSYSIREMEKLGVDISKGGTFLSDVVDHPSLFKQYPGLSDYRVVSGKGASYIGGIDGKTISLNMDKIKNAKDLKSVMLHEIQHAIQEKEGFARGGSPSSMPNLRAELGDRLDDLDYSLQNLRDAITKKEDMANIKDMQGIYRVGFQNGNKELKELYTQFSNESAKLRKEILKTKSPTEQYRSLAGEVESRDVSARMGLTPKQRLGTMPLSSQNIPLKDMIVNKNSGVSASNNIGGIGKVNKSPLTPLAEEAKGKFYQIETSNKTLPSRNPDVYREFEYPDGTRYVAVKRGNTWKETRWNTLNEAVKELQQTENIKNVREWGFDYSGKAKFKDSSLNELLSQATGKGVKRLGNK